jgi:hypothetical protein
MASIIETAGGSDLRRKSRAAAFWYLLITVTGPLIVFYFPSKLLIPGDAAATLANITARQGLFRLGLLVDFISLTAFLMTALALYALLEDVDRGRARTMVSLVVASVSLSLAGELFKAAPLLIASSAGHLKVFAPAQLQSLALLSLGIQGQAVLFVQLFWGLWLLPLGILVIRSGFFPRFLGILQLVAGAGYVAGFVAALVFPGAPGWVGTAVTVMILGELPFILWLAVRGARPKPA